MVIGFLRRTAIAALLLGGITTYSAYATVVWADSRVNRDQQDETSTQASYFRCLWMVARFFNCMEEQCANQGTCLDTDGDCHYDSC